jgi:hypothetical protein
MNVFERLFKLWGMICKMILDGVRDPEKVAEALQAIVDGSTTVVWLKSLFTYSTTELASTNVGGETLAEANDVFAGGIYNAKKRSSGKAKKVLSVAVYEMIKDGTFAQIFSSFGKNLKSLACTESLIVTICRDHPHLLCTDGHSTFFLFEGENGGFCVAFVHVRKNGQLRIYVRPLEYEFVWRANRRHRVVVPQL